MSVLTSYTNTGNIMDFNDKEVCGRKTPSLVAVMGFKAHAQTVLMCPRFRKVIAE